MSDERLKSDLEVAQELFEFLQGKIPDGCKIAESAVPKLTPDQAYTVLWWLGSGYIQISDYINRCDICGDLYDSNDSGWCFDFGKSPIFFCDACENTPEFAKKYKKAKRKNLV